MASDIIHNIYKLVLWRQVLSLQQLCTYERKKNCKNHWYNSGTGRSATVIYGKKKKNSSKNQDKIERKERKKFKKNQTTASAVV